MENKANAFIDSSSIALHDGNLQTALDRGTTRAVNNRITAMAETTDASALRQQGRAARLRALQRLPELLDQLETNLTKRGVKVLWAEDAAACNRLVIEIAREHHVRKAIKGKSMATEETKLNHALEAAGIEVIESDLGEFIVQIADETPSHIVFPILHKTKEQVRDLFVEHLDMPPSDDHRCTQLHAAEIHRSRDGHHGRELCDRRDGQPRHRLERRQRTHDEFVTARACRGRRHRESHRIGG